MTKRVHLASGAAEFELERSADRLDQFADLTTWGDDLILRITKAQQRFVACDDLVGTHDELLAEVALFRDRVWKLKR